MQLMFRSSILFIGVALVLAPAYCTTITTYGDAASWQAATTAGYQTVTFEGLTAPGTDTYFTGPTGVTVSGVEFIGVTSSGGSSVQVIDTSAFPWYNDGSGDALLQDTDRANSSSPIPYINIVLPANITALGMNLFSTSPQALSYSITVDGIPYTVPTFNQPTLAFWGITSDTPLSSLQLALQGTTYNSSSHELIDNFSFGTAVDGGSEDPSPTPEAGTYLLIGSGLIGLVAIRKRLKPDKTARN
jgi:PEP-CTERM motif